jgi:uncharacterized protein (TIGR00369 family)
MSKPSAQASFLSLGIFRKRLNHPRYRMEYEFQGGRAVGKTRTLTVKSATETAIRREMLRRFRDSTSSRTFGLRLRDVRRGRVTLEMRAERRFLQAHGRVHGGVIALLADTAAALAVYTAVPPRSRVLTLEMKINFLAGVESGAIAARGKVLRVGRSTGVSECEVRDSRGRLDAKALVTVAISPPPQSSPRNETRKPGP